MGAADDPENYSLFADLAIILTVMAFALALVGGAAYAAWSVWNAAQAGLSALTDEAPPPESAPGEKKSLRQRVEEAMGVRPTAAPPEPVPAATLRFEPMGAQSSADGNWRIYGELVNASPFAVGQAEVELAFRGKNGEVLDTQSTSVALVALGPGERRPVNLALQSRQGSTAFEILTTRATPTDAPERHPSLEVSMSQRRARRGQTVLRGTVRNTGETPAHDVSVQIIAYRDKEQTQALGVATTLLDTPLAPGEKRSFETKPILLKRRALQLRPSVVGYLAPARPTR